MAAAYALEKHVAITAVSRACQLTASVFKKLVNAETVIKGDKSPVTVADISAQAVINTVLGNAFPEDPVIGEEDTSELRLDTDPARLLRERIVQLASDTLGPAPSSEEIQDSNTWGLGTKRTEAELLDAIDRGTYAGGAKGRMWTLDPIDGTKGFLRGEQYAVCLALIVDSVVQVGVMGCPNLPLAGHSADGERGCLFVAVRGQGAEQRPLSAPFSAPTKISIPPLAPNTAPHLLESVEAAHSSHGFSAQIAKTLGITAAPVRMDSQAKYCELARSGGVYLRVPVGKGYIEKIWDHAPGSLLIHEAGGIVSDMLGQPLNFGLGRTLGENKGVVAAGKGVHASVIEAIRKVREEEAKQK
ncbi:hypothetical protein FRC12_005348 [Ceratobasidium sp. 428]|nr:hypothetical protein FRC12_005348 [Ceratobasidium sp. 428]